LASPPAQSFFIDVESLSGAVAVLCRVILRCSHTDVCSALSIPCALPRSRSVILDWAGEVKLIFFFLF
ncbi:hypothetical protein ACJQ6O_003961, partial [Yersinia enterocolitica]